MRANNSIMEKCLQELQSINRIDLLGRFVYLHDLLPIIYRHRVLQELIHNLKPNQKYWDNDKWVFNFPVTVKEIIHQCKKDGRMADHSFSTLVWFAPPTQGIKNI